MVVAGIDEAGYGPLLGPLVVGCAAFHFGDMPGDPPAAGDMPCAWQRLRKLVSKSRSKSGRKIHINDSKAIYSPTTGLRELERSLLSIIAATGPWPDDLSALLARCAPRCLPELPDYPWYQPFDGETFPCEQEATPIRLFAKALAGEMDRNRCRCVHLQAHVVPERRLNRMFEQTHNKSAVLFSTAAMHLDHLLNTFGQQNLTIVCDRQGGRARYGSLLRMMFEAWSLQIVAETDGRSEYVLSRDGHDVRVIFTEKAEAQCLPVALASMLSKYLREMMMRRFNAWWKRLLPDLQPTAGYYSDGSRFLQDIASKRQELGITDDLLIRSR